MRIVNARRGTICGVLAGAFAAGGLMLTVEAATTRRATATGGDASLRHQSVLCVVPQRTPENWRAFAGEGRRVRCGSIIGPYAAKGPGDTPARRRPFVSRPVREVMIAAGVTPPKTVTAKTQQIY